MKRITVIYKLNPEPTDVQYAQFRRHQEAGTTPGNPKWYERERLKVKPFKFVAGLPPKYPHLPTGAQHNAVHNPNSAAPGRPVTTRYVDGTSRTWEPGRGVS